MSTRPTIININPPQSLFRLVDSLLKEPNTGWDRPLHRLCSLMRKMGAKTVIKEKLEPNKDAELAAEAEDLYYYFQTNLELKCDKITFINDNIVDPSEINQLADNVFLCTCLLVQFLIPLTETPLWSSYILRAKVALPSLPIDSKGEKGRRPLLNNYFHVNKLFRCKIATNTDYERHFRLRGNFFCQQNRFTSVCAHASLKMIVNNFPGKRQTSRDINNSINIKPKKTDERFANGWGLSIDEVIKAIQAQGLSCKQWNFFSYPTWDYSECIHRLIESKLPTLLVFSTAGMRHVVPVVGHTLNSDMWRPEAEFQYRDLYFRMSDQELFGVSKIENHISSSAWIDHFIIHDDNFGPYYCLSVDSLRRPTLPKWDPHFRAFLVLGVYPRDANIKTPAREAEWASVLLLEDLAKEGVLNGYHNYWLDQIVRTYNNNEPWVVRTALIGNLEYRNYLLQVKDHEENGFTDQEVDEIVKDLPPWVYITEISLSDLYTTNKSKIADILYEVNLPPWDSKSQNKGELYERIKLVRFPENVFDSNKHFRVKQKSHLPLFRVDPMVNQEEW